MIKVLHIHTRGIIGGSGTNTLLSMEGLPKEKYEPVLVCGSEGQLVEEARKRNFRIIIIPHMRNTINIFNDLMAVRELAAAMKNESCTIAHTHNSKAGVLGRVAAKLAGVPIIVHTQHGSAFRYPSRSIFMKKLFIAVERFVGRFTDRIITISNPVKKELLTEKIVPEEKISIAYSGIEINRFKKNIDIQDKRREFSIADDFKIIGSVGRLDGGKGQDVIIKAIPAVVRENKKVKFIFVGDGPSRNKLECLAKTIGVADNVVFTGLREDVAELLKAFDVFCFASEYEGMGRVILEAQAAGLPIVATKVGGIVDIVIEGKTALLVEPRNPEALAGAINRLIKDDNLRSEIAKAAREFVDYKFSSEKMVKDIIQAYEELLKTKLEKL